jgi:hypothetical protein
METAALKIILELKEQNTLMKRGISEALVMLIKRHHHPFLNYEDKNITGLLNEIGRLVEDLNKSNRPEQPEEDPI